MTKPSHAQCSPILTGQIVTLPKRLFSRGPGSDVDMPKGSKWKVVRVFENGTVEVAPTSEKYDDGGGFYLRSDEFSI